MKKSLTPSFINDALEDMRKKEEAYIQAKKEYKRLLRSYIKSFN